MQRLEVVAAVFVCDGNVLACRRAPGKSAAGKWEFPGGKIDDDDETPKAALVREIQEELGISISVVDAPIDRPLTLDGYYDVNSASAQRGRPHQARPRNTIVNSPQIVRKNNAERSDIAVR